MSLSQSQPLFIRGSISTSGTQLYRPLSFRPADVQNSSYQSPINSETPILSILTQSTLQLPLYDTTQHFIHALTSHDNGRQSTNLHEEPTDTNRSHCVRFGVVCTREWVLSTHESFIHPPHPSEHLLILLWSSHSLGHPQNASYGWASTA